MKTIAIISCLLFCLVLFSPAQPAPLDSPIVTPGVEITPGLTLPPIPLPGTVRPMTPGVFKSPLPQLTPPFRPTPTGWPSAPFPWQTPRAGTCPRGYWCLGK